MVNRNGTVFLALFAFATAIAIAACSGGANSIPGTTLGGDRSAQTQAQQNWGSGHSAGPDVPSPYPTTNGESWAFAHTSQQAEKIIGQKGEQVSDTTGTLDETYNQGSEEYAYSLSYTTTSHNSKLVIFGSSSRDLFVAYDTGGACPATDTCFDETFESGSGSTTNSNGGSSSTSYSVFPYTVFTMDILNGTTGADGVAKSWNDATGYTNDSSGSFTDGHGNTTSTSTAYSRNPDGSYSNTTNVSTTHGSWTNTSSQASGGAGNLVNNGGGPTGGTTTWSDPVPQNGRYVIPVVFNPTHGGTESLSPADWYPGGGPAPTLWTDTTHDLGTITVPTKCGTDAGDIAELLSEKTTFLDVVVGTFSQVESQRYVVTGQGVICQDEQRLLDYYDNYITGNLVKTVHAYTLDALESYTPARINHGKHSARSIRGFSVR